MTSPKPTGYDFRTMKDTRNKVRGSAHPGSKLTEEKVRLIREAYRLTPVRHAHLAQQFGVSQPTISNVINRRDWKHVT